MKRQYFFHNEYRTDESPGKIEILNRIRRSRFVFIVRMIGVVIRSRRKALNGTYGFDEWAGSSMEIMRLLEKTGAIFNISGLDNLKNLKKPVVIISNHMSVLETMVFPGIIAPYIDVTFVVKDSLVNYPLFGPIMRSRNPIVVSRENSRDDLLVVMNEGKRLLNEGTSVIIFPQSTRRSYLKIDEFNSLGVKLAARGDALVIPAAIKTNYWINGRYVKDLGPFDRKQQVNIDFGEPIIVEGNGKSTHQKVIEFISSRLKIWNVEVVE